MKIRINGADADIRPETEKTVGEILSALEAWLEGTGHRLSGLGIDGKTVAVDSMEVCFGMDIDTVDTLDVYTSSIMELLEECLSHALEAIDIYESADFEEKGLLAVRWHEGPAARLLAEQTPDLSSWITKTFSGEGSGPQALRSMVDERLRELRDPAGELDRLGVLVTEICARLEELPLDIQTGKDAKAAETMGVFSSITEKVFRIFGVLKTGGFPIGEVKVGDVSVTDYINEFHTALQDLLNAYEQQDSVLVGDIAEYEMAPRLRGLHAAVWGAVKGNCQ
ncbi:MAG: hypothetical protein FWD88_04010 [Treponema sp.]|nr:hypothetical protein [Treponema sp.]